MATNCDCPPFKKRKIDFVDDVFFSCSLESILTRLQFLEQEKKNSGPFKFLKVTYFCNKLSSYEIIQEDVFGNQVRNELMKKTFELCSNNNNNDKEEIFFRKERFPGCMPCSLSKKDLKNIVKENKEYMICEKSDGFRYFMICTTLIIETIQIIENKKTINNSTGKKQNICFLLDRDMNIVIVQIGWMDTKIYKEGTIFDGELIQTKNGEWKYRIFDIVCIAGYKNIKNETYKKRIEKATQILDKIYCPNIMDTFQIEIKKIYETKKVNLLLNKIENNYFDHAIDGIIFVPNKDSVYLKGGTQRNLFKWKANVEHTIDFAIRKKTETEYVLYIMVQHFQPHEIEKKAHLMEDTKTKLLDLLPILKYESNLKEFTSEKEIIVECKYYPPLDSWVPIKYRADKKLPNGYRTFKNTLDVIKDPILKKDLIDFFLWRRLARIS